MRRVLRTSIGTVLLCFINPRVRKIRNEASSCPGSSPELSAFTISLAPPVRDIGVYYICRFHFFPIYF